MDPLAPEVPEQLVHILAEVAEVGVSAGAESEDREAHVGERTEAVDRSGLRPAS